MSLKLGHVTYLQGESNTLFTNDNATGLFWTQVVPNWQGSSSTRGLLFDYSLEPPHHFRHGVLDASASPGVPNIQPLPMVIWISSHLHAPSKQMRWGAHAFSRVTGVNAMMITSTNQMKGLPGTCGISPTTKTPQLLLTTALAGFTIHAVFLNETLPSLSFVDPLLVNASRLPSLGQSISTSSLP